MAKRIAILTGGGHISSFHAGMLGVCRAAEELGYTVVGIRDGYIGTVGDGQVMPLTASMIEPDRAGSLIGSSREKADEKVVQHLLAKQKIDALIVMGGNDHLGEAAMLAGHGLPVVGWPKTMDNDLSKTYFTLGFPTAVTVGARAVREAFADAITNSRVHVLTLFGRQTDWVATACGVWGAADVIVPAEKYVEKVHQERYAIRTIFDRVEAAREENRKRYGRPFAVVAVAEGAALSGCENHINKGDKDKHGNLKIEPMKLAVTIKDFFRDFGGKEYPIGIDAITYTMRNTAPTDLDRRLAEEAGRTCVKAIHEGQFGQSGCIRHEQGRFSVGLAPLAEVSRQRFMRPEGYFDYDAMAVRPSFAEYYAPVFGKPPSRDDAVYKALRTNKS